MERATIETDKVTDKTRTGSLIQWDETRGNENFDVRENE